MSNPALAAVLERIGKILELQGENVFRVRAYARAAETIASYPQDLADICKKGGIKALQEIPGIGADLSQKIEELVTTGELQYLKDLEKTVPAGLFDLLQIPGMGPKKTKQVWEEFKVEGIPDLQKLLDSGKLEDVKGWGAKSVQKVRDGIAERATLSERIPLGEALALAEELLAYLRATGLCSRVDTAGSLRRRRETIGDIDILAASETPEAVMEAFSQYPGQVRVIGRGETKTSILLGNGIQSDLRVVPPDVFGAALHYFTGSKLHNVKVRGMGNKQGVTINEYGVFKGSADNKGKLLASRTEEDVFKAVGLPYIPPEMREDRGEVEAAQQGTLPELLQDGDIQGDLHLHSDFSDGAGSMIDMAKAAQELGLKYIAVTDHASGMGMVGGIKPDNIAQYLALVEKARKAVPGIHILAGAEVDILADGSLYLPDEILAQLDWVVASVHQSFKESREETTERLLRAIANPHVRVLGHPTTRLLAKRPGIEFDTDTVFTAAAERGVLLELNASAERLDLSDVHCRRAKELGATLVIDSDAHHVRSLHYALGITQARRAWLTKADVANAWDWKTFEKRILRGKK